MASNMLASCSQIRSLLLMRRWSLQEILSSCLTGNRCAAPTRNLGNEQTSKIRDITNEARSCKWSCPKEHIMRMYVTSDTRIPRSGCTVVRKSSQQTGYGSRSKVGQNAWSSRRWCGQASTKNNPITRTLKCHVCCPTWPGDRWLNSPRASLGAICLEVKSPYSIQHANHGSVTWAQHRNDNK